MRKYKYEDLTGKRFDKLVVISRTEDKIVNGYKRQMWLCLCDCGNYITKEKQNLKRYKNINCGCVNNKYIDLTGLKFGRWVVERLAEESEIENETSSSKYWLCVCSCENKTKKVVSSSNLRRGSLISCGCYHSEIMAQVGRKNKGMKKKPTMRKELSEIAIRDAFYRYKKNANRRHLSFELSFDNFVQLIHQNCFYCDCGLSLKFFRKRNPEEKEYYYYNGIDRVDNSRGYSIDNCVPCCGDCNRAKWKLGTVEFLAWIERVYNHSIKNQKQII